MSRISAHGWKGCEDSLCEEWREKEEAAAFVPWRGEWGRGALAMPLLTGYNSLVQTTRPYGALTHAELLQGNPRREPSALPKSVVTLTCRGSASSIVGSKFVWD